MRSLGIVGGGNMGEAMVRGVVESGLLTPDRLFVTDVVMKRLEMLKEKYGINTVPRPRELHGKVDTLVLAVKPQNMDQVLEELRPALSVDTLVISIAAGVPSKKIERGLKEGVRVIRVMPNMPALYLQGAAALCKGRWALNEDLETASSLFAAMGTALVVDEKVMDAVTGLSGSGPAYVFLFIEALSDGGVRMGLPRDTAFSLAVQTVLGAAKALSESGEHPARMKELVTSPGGTTIAGLHELERNAFRGAVMDAVEAATLRSQALGAD